MINKVKQRLLWSYVKSITGGGMLPANTTSQPRWTRWDTKKAIDEGYKASVYVYSCIDRIAKAAASVPWHVERFNSQTNEWERVPLHPLQELIEKPNPFTSKKDFIERLTAHLYLTGNAYHTKIRVNNRVVELWNADPGTISAIPSRTDFIKAYKFQSGEITREIEPQDLMHHMFIDPGDPFSGLAPLQVAARTVDTDIEAVAWNKVALQNRAVTDGVFTFDTPLNEQQWRESRRQVREQHQGAENARAPWVLGSGARWQQMSLSPADMDFIQGRKVTREEICSIFHVPPPMVGLYENATLSNIETARKIFWLDTVIPFLEDLQDTFNLSLTPDFEGGNERLRLVYDVSNVEAIADNFKEKVETARELWRMGVPLNSINKRLELGLDEVEGGDVGYIPSSQLPVNMQFDDLDPAKSDTGGTHTKKGKAAAAVKDIQAGINIQTKDEKATYWKSKERQRIPFYRDFEAKAAGMFRRELQAIKKALRSGGTDAVIQVIDDNAAEWRKLYKDQYRRIIAHFGSGQFNSFKSCMQHSTKDDERLESDIAFDPYDEIIQTYVDRVGGQKIVNVTDTTKRNVRRIMGSVLEDEGTVDDIAKVLEERYDFFSKHRSYRIARTEVVAASNFGTHAATRQTGLNVEKEWIGTYDDRVRDSHDPANPASVAGERLPMDTLYSNGLLYPGDMLNGPPEEVIHCRCAEIYHTIGGAAPDQQPMLDEPQQWIDTDY